MATLTILVSHLDAAQVRANLDHLDAMGAGERVVLCHGGPREHFDEIDLEEKVFLEDEGLRGPAAYLQSYTEALVEVHRRFVAPDPSVTEILLIEFDQVILAPGFADTLVALMDESGADFLGKTCTDRTGTNWWHRVRYRDDERLLSYLRGVSVREDPTRIYGCLGTGFIMRRAVLEAFASVDHPDGVYVELYLPTLIHHLGFRVEDVDRLSPIYQHVRWTPPYTLDEVNTLKASGAAVVHPFKEMDELPHLAQAR